MKYLFLNFLGIVLKVDRWSFIKFNYIDGSKDGMNSSRGNSLVDKEEEISSARTSSVAATFKT